MRKIEDSKKAGMVVLGASQVAVMIKNLPANAGDIRGRPLGQEDPLEEGMAMHCSILAWRIPGTEDPQSRGSLLGSAQDHTPAVGTQGLSRG